MSATLDNCDLLQKWIDCEIYITNFRPVPLTEYLKVGNEVVDKQGVVQFKFPLAMKSFKE
jgi:DNA polymerase theta